MFSAIRARGGYNDNPTVAQARAALRAVTCNELIKSTSASKNCETTDMDFLLPTLPPKEVSTSFVESNEPEPVDEIPEVLSGIIDDVTPIHRDAYAYVTGHTIRRFITCKTCLDALISPTVQTPFVRNKSYVGCVLFDPIQPVVEEVECLKVKAFAFLDQVAHLDGIVAKMKSHVDIRNMFLFDFLHHGCREAVQKVLLTCFCSFFVKVFCLRKCENIKTHRMQTLKKMKKLVN